MNLATLWVLERTRMATHADGAMGSGSPHPRFMAAHESQYTASSSIPEDRKAPTLMHVNSSARLTSVTAQSQQQQQHAGMESNATSTPKRRASVFTKRDVAFRKLVDESVVPAVHTVGATVQNFFDCNEFAMEYAERAPKRSVYQAPCNISAGNGSNPSASSTSGTNGSANPSACHHHSLSNDSNSSSAGASGVVSPIRKDKKLGSTPSTPGRAASTRGSGAAQGVNAGHGASTSNAALVGPGGLSNNPAMAASNSLLNAALSSPKAPFLARKNGRKKVGSEFHSRAFRPYVGDIFGTRGEYIDGMLYMSRMKRSYQITFGDSSSYGRTSAPGAAWGMDLARTNEGRHALKDAVSDALSTASTATNGALSGASTTNKAFGTAALELSDAARLAAVDDPGYDNLQAKQRRRCSLTLSNWSSNPENAVLMVQENVVEALILLCKPNDSVTRLHCVTALMNLSHIVELRKVIVRQGAVKTVAEIVDETEEKTLRTACAITLCNLCCLEGEEEVLVQDGAVSALSVLITEQPKVSWLCRTALFNLTCVREPYQKIESVLKMFITLTTSSGGVSTEDCDEITAKALCNLSNFKRIRLRLMEEGIVSAISSLIHMHASEIQEMLAYVMFNLSAVRACRGEMVAKGCMGTLISLTGATGAIAAKLLIASTLFNLSKEPGNRLRMVFEGLLLLVNELCRGPLGYAAGSEALRRVCASTLYNISCNEDTRVKLVERDAVSILSSLSKRTTDTNAKKMCTLALCNLLSVQQAAADIMNAGAITALIQLSMAPDQTLETKRVFSQALHGLCQQSETRDAVARAGVIQAIIYLSSVKVPNPGTAAVDTAPLTPEHSKVLREIRARCTAALACLAADERQTTQVCNVEVVLCVTRILVLERSYIAIERFCCSCLSLLCRDEHCSQIMADEGAIQVVLSTCMETQDLETKASCCHVLASMSCHPSCCMALVRMGVISVLATLAKIKGDTGIQRCCAITLANLSAEPAIRDVLVTAGIVGILSMLSNSYSEESQRDCAKVLCNLSCVPGNEAHLVAEGAIGVLMMISMVRAVNATTKDTCVRALFNLLNAETIKRMVQEGLVKVLPTFAALEMGNALDIVTMLFMKLVNHPVGRNALCTERSSLKSLFALMEHSLATSRDNRSTFSLFESLLCELVHYENSRLPSVNAGIVDALHKLTIRTSTNSLLELSEDAESTSCMARRLALVLFTLSKYEETRMAAASSASIATLTTFLKRHPPRSNCSDGECVVFAVSTICSLAWHEITCSRLEHPEISSVLVQLLTTNSGLDGVLGGASNPKIQLGYHYPACAIKTTVLTLCCLSHNQEMLTTLLNDRIIDCVYGILCQDSVQQHCDANAQLVKDREFLALVCILFRQLSHMSLFKSMIAGQHSLVIPLFCTLTELVAGNDTESSLDCADALCSITFASVRSANISPPPADSSVTKSDRIPCAALVAPNVMKAIASLAAENQLAETRWRSTASLWALSLVPEYRDRLVALGCTRLLVDESYRTETNAYLSILKCCAGALCNLTMPVASFSGGGDHIHSIAHTNAARMVDEGAVPALLQLSKLENTDIREHCTLALTNLSGQSPKVESGAVSALLNLSLQATLPSSSHRPGTVHTGALSRPPIVNNARHKQFAKLPDFPMVIERHETLGECKYEADLVASTPPPPHLPTIPVVGIESSEDDNSGGTGKSSNDNDELAPLTSSGHDDSGGQSGGRDADARVTTLRRFPKVDPAESRLLGGTGDGDEDSGGGSDNNNESPHDHSLNQEMSDGDNAGSNDGEDVRFGADNEDSSEVGETLGQLRKTVSNKNGVGSSAGYSLSPLARVVVRKTQTAQVAKKLKELRGCGSTDKRGDGGSSGMSTPVSSARTDNSTALLLASAKWNSITANGGSSKAILSYQPNHDNNKALRNDDCSSSVAEAAHMLGLYSSSSQSEVGKTQSISDARSSLAAAAAAARLYAAPVREGALDRGGPKIVLHHGSKKREKVVKKQHRKSKFSSSSKAKYTPAASILRSHADSEDDDGMPVRDEPETSVVVTSVLQEFRAQAKKFGLWS